MANRRKVYYYRIILQAATELKDYQIDKYKIGGQEIWKGLAEKVESFMGGFPTANSSRPFNLDNTRAYSIELDMDKVGSGIQGQLDNIDAFIKQTINSVATTTETDIPNPPVIDSKRTSGSNWQPSNDPFNEYTGASEFTITFKGKDKTVTPSNETYQHTIQIVHDAGAVLLDFEINGEPYDEIILDSLENYMNTAPNKATIVNAFEIVESTRQKFFVRCFFNTTDREIIKDQIKALDDIVSTKFKEATKSAQESGKLTLEEKSRIETEYDVNIYGKGKADQFTIRVKKGNVPPADEYVPDTTQFKKRGLVKIQGEEQYRAVGQVIGKDLVGNPSSVASDNQTHLNGSDSDEQAENSVEVALWHYKKIGADPTADQISNYHYGSNLKSQLYKDEKFRIHNILEPGAVTR